MLLVDAAGLEMGHKLVDAVLVQGGAPAVASPEPTNPSTNPSTTSAQSVGLITGLPSAFASDDYFTAPDSAGATDNGSAEQGLVHEGSADTGNSRDGCSGLSGSLSLASFGEAGAGVAGPEAKSVRVRRPGSGKAAAAAAEDGPAAAATTHKRKNSWRRSATLGHSESQENLETPYGESKGTGGLGLASELPADTAAGLQLPATDQEDILRVCSTGTGVNTETQTGWTSGPVQGDDMAPGAERTAEWTKKGSWGMHRGRRADALEADPMTGRMAALEAHMAHADAEKEELLRQVAAMRVQLADSAASEAARMQSAHDSQQAQHIEAMQRANAQHVKQSQYAHSMVAMHDATAQHDKQVQHAQHMEAMELATAQHVRQAQHAHNLAAMQQASAQHVNESQHAHHVEAMHAAAAQHAEQMQHYLQQTQAPKTSERTPAPPMQTPKCTVTSGMPGAPGGQSVSIRVREPNVTRLTTSRVARPSRVAPAAQHRGPAASLPRVEDLGFAATVPQRLRGGASSGAPGEEGGHADYSSPRVGDPQGAWGSSPPLRMKHETAPLSRQPGVSSAPAPAMLWQSTLAGMPAAASGPEAAAQHRFGCLAAATPWQGAGSGASQVAALVEAPSYDLGFPPYAPGPELGESFNDFLQQMLLNPDNMFMPNMQLQAP